VWSNTIISFFIDSFYFYFSAIYTENPDCYKEIKDNDEYVQYDIQACNYKKFIDSLTIDNSSVANLESILHFLNANQAHKNVIPMAETGIDFGKLDNFIDQTFNDLKDATICSEVDGDSTKKIFIRNLPYSNNKLDHTKFKCKTGDKYLESKECDNGIGFFSDELGRGFEIRKNPGSKVTSFSIEGDSATCKDKAFPVLNDDEKVIAKEAGKEGTTEPVVADKIGAIVAGPSGSTKSEVSTPALVSDASKAAGVSLSTDINNPATAPTDTNKPITTPTDTSTTSTKTVPTVDDNPTTASTNTNKPSTPPRLGPYLRTAEEDFNDELKSAPQCEYFDCTINYFYKESDVAIKWEANPGYCYKITLPKVLSPLEPRNPPLLTTPTPKRKVLCSKIGKKALVDKEPKNESPATEEKKETEESCKAKIPSLKFDEKKKECIAEVITDEAKCKTKGEEDVDAEYNRPLNNWTWDSATKECIEKSNKGKDDDTDGKKASSEEKTPTIYPNKPIPARFIPTQIPSRQCYLYPGYV
jgi:hypothetical protein